MPKAHVTPDPTPEGVTTELTVTVNGQPATLAPDHTVDVPPGATVEVTQVNVDAEGQESDPSDPKAVSLPPKPAKPNAPTITFTRA